jgi:hypothetical protein
MFEFFKPREERLHLVRFMELLEMSEFRELYEKADALFHMELDEDGGNASGFDEDSGFIEAVKEMQKWLDAHGVRVTEDAIIRVMAEKLDPQQDVIN